MLPSCLTSQHYKTNNLTKEMKKKALKQFIPPPSTLEENIPLFRGEWDDEGVYVYQAYNSAIADWALEHQSFGGPAWKPARMTWIKPSFAWMLYRCGYGHKTGQTRVLKMKLSHDTIAYLLSHCKCVHTGEKLQSSGGEIGRVQWDPERDLFQSDGKRKEPRRMGLRQRAIQIGLPGSISEYYVSNIISIEEVTDLAHEIGLAHNLKAEEDTSTAMNALKSSLPDEQPYLPDLSKRKLEELAMLPGPSAEAVVQIGRGQTRSE